MMKKLLSLASMFVVIMTLCFGFISCNDEEEKKPNKNDYSNVLTGRWYVRISDDIIMGLDIDYQGVVGRIRYWKEIDQEFGVSAEGSYSLDGDELTAYYDDIMVFTEDDSLTFEGFSEGKNKTVVYTIMSCDSKKLVIKNENGETLNLERNN